MPLEYPRTPVLYQKLFSVMEKFAGVAKSKRKQFLSEASYWRLPSARYSSKEFVIGGKFGSKTIFKHTEDAFFLEHRNSFELSPTLKEDLLKVNIMLKELFVPPEVCPECEFELKTGLSARNSHSCETAMDF